MFDYRDGGEAIVDAFTSEDVKVIFGVPGLGELPIFNALCDNKNISFITTYFENSAALMADTYGRLTGKPGVCINIAGPGNANCINAIAQAAVKSSPLIHISSDFRTDDRVLSYHGIDDFKLNLKLFEPVTKWSVRIKKVEDIHKILSKAFNVALSGKPGPVHLQIPMDVLNSKAEFGRYTKTEVIRNGASEYLIDDAVDLLVGSSQPFIYAGLGVVRSFASDEIIELAELVGAPIGTTFSALDTVPYDHPLYVGNLRQANPNIPNLCNDIMSVSDTVIVIGTGLGGDFTRPLKKFKKIVHIDYGEKLDYYRVVDLRDFEPRIKLFGDIKMILKQIIVKLGKKKTLKTKLKRRIAGLKREVDIELEKTSSQKTEPVHPYVIVSELMKAIDKDAILTPDVGSFGRWLPYFKAYKPNTILLHGRWDSMGTGLAMSLAAKLLNPDKQVINITGDGGFMMAPMELGTAVRYNLNVVVIIAKNKKLGSVWRHQKRLWAEDRTYATEVYCPDFVKYAESFGAKGISVNNRAELKKAIDEALNSDKPVVIDVTTQHNWKGMDLP